MKVKALKVFHDSRLHSPGDVYDEADAVAKDRIKAGLVEKVKDDKPESSEPPKRKAKG